MSDTQQLFMLFYAIIWGTAANAWPRWKPFHWTLIFLARRVAYRTALSFLILNVCAITYFIVIFSTIECDSPYWWVQALRGSVPAFAAFGWYRVWMGIVERWPKTFYYEENEFAGALVEYKDIEPPIRLTALPPLAQPQLQPAPGEELPPTLAPNTVHVRPNLWPYNVGAGATYIVVSWVTLAVPQSYLLLYVAVVAILVCTLWYSKRPQN